MQYYIVKVKFIGIIINFYRFTNVYLIIYPNIFDKTLKYVKADITPILSASGYVFQM